MLFVQKTIRVYRPGLASPIWRRCWHIAATGRSSQCVHVYTCMVPPDQRSKMAATLFCPLFPLLVCPLFETVYIKAVFLFSINRPREAVRFTLSQCHTTTLPLLEGFNSPESPWIHFLLHTPNIDVMLLCMFSMDSFFFYYIYSIEMHCYYTCSVWMYLYYVFLM